MTGLSAFVWQTAALLLAAYFLGACIGCFLRRLFAPAPKVAMEASELRAAPVPTEKDLAAAKFGQALKGKDDDAAVVGAAAATAAAVAGGAAASQPSAVAPVEKATVAPAPEPRVAERIRTLPETAPGPGGEEASTDEKPGLSAASAVGAAAATATAVALSNTRGAPEVPVPASAPATVVAQPVAASSGQAAATAPVAPEPVSVPASAAPAAVATDDDLTLISGIDAETAGQLREAGATSFAQIADWTAEEVKMVDDHFGFERGVATQNWIEQAALLKSGTLTAYARRRLHGLEPSVVAAPAAGEPVPEPADPVPDVSLATVATAAAAVATGAVAAEAVQRSDEAVTPAINAAPAPVETSPQPTPPSSASALPARDDLTQIDGINEEVEATLLEQGVTRFSQVASWNDAEQERFDRRFGASGRVQRERWVAQARELAGYPAVEAASAAEPEEAAAPSLGEAAPVSVRAPVVSETASQVSDETRVAAEAVAASSRNVTTLRSVRSAALVGAGAANGGAGDDLKRIRGIGVLIEKKLRGMGITRYEQVAGWTQSDVDRISHHLDFRGRIERESWIEQARILSSGGQTEFSRRADRD